MSRTMKFGILAAALLAVIVMPAWATRPLPPSPPPGPADIAYGSTTDLGGDLTLMQRDGSGKWVIYSSPRLQPVGRPDWSHDGRLIIFNNYDTITVVEAATAKSCVLTGSMTGMDPIQGSPKFNPAYPNPAGEGTYVVAWSDYVIDRVTGRRSNDIFSTAFKFQEGTCLMTLPIRNLTMTPTFDEQGSIWSPLGDHLASVVTGSGIAGHLLRLYDTTELEYGRVVFSGEPDDHNLTLGYLAMHRWDETTLQWRPNSNRVALIGTWSPDGVTQAGEIVWYDLGTHLWGRYTGTPEVEGYFDFMPDGVGIVVQRDDGVHLYPGDTLLASEEVIYRRFMKMPTQPAWNPTRP